MFLEYKCDIIHNADALTDNIMCLVSPDAQHFVPALFSNGKCNTPSGNADNYIVKVFSSLFLCILLYCCYSYSETTHFCR